jgi:hypothetical protein
LKILWPSDISMEHIILNLSSYLTSRIQQVMAAKAEATKY